MRGSTLRVWNSSPLFPEANSRLNDRIIATGAHICRVHLCDWDRDGTQDYLLGELGSFPVGDHQKGRVSLLIGGPDDNVEKIILAENLGRVVEAKPFDYDDDLTLSLENGPANPKLIRLAASGDIEPQFQTML